MKRILMFLIVPVLAFSCKQMKPNSTSNESYVDLSWSFQGNNVEQGYYSATFILENQGETTLSDKVWALYFNQQGLGVMDESVTGNVKIEHINGDLIEDHSHGRIQSGVRVLRLKLPTANQVPCSWNQKHPCILTWCIEGNRRVRSCSSHFSELQHSALSFPG